MSSRTRMREAQSEARLLSIAQLLLLVSFALITSHPAFGQITNFKHIVYIVQENRTPDNLFQGLCYPPIGRTTACSTTPGTNQYDIQTANWLDKTSSNGVTQPIPTTLTGTFDMSHAHSGFLSLCDFNSATGVCRMDGQAGNHCDPNCPIAKAQFEYVDYTSGILNPYLTMATQYGWANYMFQTNQGPSFAAHHFIFGGTSAPTSADDALGIFAAENAQPSESASGCIATTSTTVAIINSSGVEFEYLYPCLEHTTLPDILPAGLTWRYYSAGAGYIGNAPTGIAHICQSNEEGGHCLGSEWLDNDINNPAQVLTDIANCNLASISWVTPTTENSDHARGNDGGGPAWVASIVNAIGNSTACDNNTGYWDNTVIFLTWDDWGGWYDHEPPPVPAAPQNGYQYGFRVPLVVISAYTPVRYIDNTRFYDFGSFLRFAEHNFGLTEGALTYADARSTTDLTKFFNLKHTPRAFQTIAAPEDAQFFINDTRPRTDPDDDN